MLKYSVVFFIVAIFAAVLGFGGIATGAVGVAKLLLLAFLFLTVVGVAMRLVDRVTT